MCADLGAGFVTAANMMQGLVAGAGAAAVAQVVVGVVVATPEVVEVGPDAPDAVPAQGATTGVRPPMRWNNNTLEFVLRRMSQIVSDGSKTDKCFKDKDVNSVAKLLGSTVVRLLVPLKCTIT
jgi:hypothetical protein